MPLVLIGALLVFVLGAGWWMYRWQYATADRVLTSWARERGLTILEKVAANEPGTGPVNRYASNKQVVYRIRVRSRDGKVQAGRATIGSERMGALQPRVQVEFDP